MPLMFKNSKVEFKWARYGGIESDDTLDAIKLLVIIDFPKQTETSYLPVDIHLPADLGFTPPSTAYLVDWGDGSKIACDLSETVGHFTHTYRKTEVSESSIQRFTVIIKGHNIDKSRFNNRPGKHYYWRLVKEIEDSTAFKREYVITVKKGDDII